MENYEISELKRQIFDLFDRARILFNDFYNGKEEYTDRDISEMYDLILRIDNENVREIERLLEEEID